MHSGKVFNLLFSHDIGLVNSHDLVSPLLGGIIEGKLGDAP